MTAHSPLQPDDRLFQMLPADEGEHASRTGGLRVFAGDSDFPGRVPVETPQPGEDTASPASAPAELPPIPPDQDRPSPSLPETPAPRD